MPEGRSSVETQRRAVIVAVLLDLFAVSLVVPLLPVRFRELGVSQRNNGLIGSVYSIAQIVGGLLLGALSDRGLGRRGLLLLSFAGAAVSYAMVGIPNASLAMLVASRVVVGLFKQTMTAATALTSELTSPGEERATWIGRLTSAATLSWIAGQSVGGVLYARGDPRLPASVAVLSYVVAFALVSVALPSSAATTQSVDGSSEHTASGTLLRDKNNSGNASPETTKEDPTKCSSSKKPSFFASFFSQKRRRENAQGGTVLTASRAVVGVAAARVATQFVGIAANNGRSLYELERWALSRADVAYLNSFKSLVAVLSSWRLASRVAKRFGFWSVVVGSTCIAVVAALVEAVPGASWRTALQYLGVTFVSSSSHWGEPKANVSLVGKAIADPSLAVYALVLFPFTAAARQVASIAMRARFTEVVPRKHTAAAYNNNNRRQSPPPVYYRLLRKRTCCWYPSPYYYRLASLDVTLSAVGVAAPVAGGVLFDLVDARRQPLLVAALNAIAAAVLLGFAVFGDDDDDKQPRQEEDASSQQQQQLPEKYEGRARSSVTNGPLPAAGPTAAVTAPAKMTNWHEGVSAGVADATAAAAPLRAKKDADARASFWDTMRVTTAVGPSKKEA